MKTNIILKKTVAFFKKHSTVISTGLIISGLTATVMCAIKDTPKAEMIINDATKEKGEELTKIEKTKLYAKSYWRTIALGAATILLVVGSQVLKDKSYASLATAYTIAEKKVMDYKDAVKEAVGEKKSEEINELLTKKQLEEKRSKDTKIYDTNSGNTLFFDTWSGREFKSNMESVRKAINDINRMMLEDGYVSVGELYWKLNLPDSEMGNNHGWNSYANKNVDVIWGSMVTEDGVPCITMRFKEDPTIDFEYYSK